MKKENAYPIFLVEDNKVYLKALKNYLTENLEMDVKIHTFSNGEDCLESLNLNPGIIILDYYLNSKAEDSAGCIEILKNIKLMHPEIAVIIISAQDNIKVATDTMKYGAFDYVSKNENAFLRIQNAVNNIYKYGLWLH